jgi:hypothetical protein
MVSGVGAGKTTLGCREVLKWTQFFPGGLYVIGRLTAKALEETTERRWFELCPTELIEHWNDSKKHLYLKTNEPNVYSEVLFMHLDQPGPLGSLDVDGFWIDEAHEPDGQEVPESTFLMLKARLRGYSGPHRGIITTNSGGKDWVWKWFFDENRRPDVAETHWGISVPTEANRDNLPPGYIEELRATHPESWVRRFLDGSFEVFEGQIFSEFDPKIHVIEPFNIPTSWPQEAGFDHGIAVPTAVPIHRIDPATGNVYLVDLFYRAEADISEVAKWMKAPGPFRDKQEWAWADPSVRNRGPNKKSVAQLYGDEGISLLPAVSNDVDLKISTWHLYFLKRKYFIFKLPETRQAIEEIQAYRWDPNNSTRPLKKDDHFIDAGGYNLVSNPQGGILDAVKPGRIKVAKAIETPNSFIHPSIYDDEDYEPDLDDLYNIVV